MRGPLTIFRVAALVCVALLMLAATSQREISWPDNRIMEADLVLTFRDTSTTNTTAGAAIIHGLGCDLQATDDVGLATSNRHSVCYVPFGQKHILYRAQWFPFEALNTNGQCKVGIASVSDGSIMDGTDLLAWSVTPIGDTTTATCDRSAIATDADLEAIGDWCENSPAAPVEFVFGDSYAMLAVEETADNCDSLKIGLFLDRRIVTLD